MMIKEPKSRFLKVRCGKCKNEQIIFEKPASDVKCLVCEEVLAESTGGKGKFKTNILEILN